MNSSIAIASSSSCIVVQPSSALLCSPTTHWLVGEFLRKNLGVDPRLLSNQEKTVLVDALREAYALRELLDRIDLPRSSVFYHRSPLRLADKYAEVRPAITEIFEDTHRCYGYRRIQAALNRRRVFISEKVVRRLMKQAGHIAARPKRRRYRSYVGEINPAPENLINRDFQATAPNEKWLTDRSEFHIPAGKVYLSPMIDCFDGMVVSWSIGTSPDAELVNTMLDAAIETVTESDEKPIVHSDRGGHYRWAGWLARVADAKLTRSMSRKACSPDNAACEGFFGRLKTEMFYPGDWRTTTIEQFLEVLDKYIRWYNEKRIKSSLGYLSPIEYRESLGLTKPVQEKVHIPSGSIFGQRQYPDRKVCPNRPFSNLVRRLKFSWTSHRSLRTLEK
jgi:putative transposase